MKKSFILYQDYLEHINFLSDEQAGKLFKAIFLYNQGHDVEMEPIVRMAFSFIKVNLDRDMEKYESVKERNKINGLKGGRPVKTEEPNETQNNPVGFSGLESVNLETQNNPKKPDTDTDTDTDTGSETVKKKNIKKKKAGFEKPEDVSEEAWEGWLALRKAKNAPVTGVVINAMRKEAGSIGWTLEQALVETCSRNWQGFKASWVQNEMAHNRVLVTARPHQNENRIDGSLRKEEIVLRLKNGAWSDAETLRHLVDQLRTLRMMATSLHEKDDLQKMINSSDLRISQLTGEKAY